MSLPKVVTRDITTLCVRKKGITVELCINPDFWEKFTDDEQVALLIHELSHIALQHMFISDSFADSKLFDLAADCEVNSYIENLPSCACTAQAFGLYNGQGTKFYYEKLSQKLPPPPPCGGSGSGSGSKQDNQDGQGNNNQQKEDTGYPNVPQGKKPIDSHKEWKSFKESTTATKQLIQNTICSILKATADQIDKQCGHIPGELIEIIEKLREKKPEIFNWKHYFRRLLGSIYDVNIKSTRRKESKRFEGAAGVQHKKKVSILVAVDTSGSVSTKELEDFFGEIEYIYKAGARVTILECDTRINQVVEYDGKHLPSIKGRKGTDFNPPVNYYVKHKKEYASLIYFTDGECSLPLKHPSGMVWVITSSGMHQNYPGKVIYIPKDHGNQI